jgi:small-conductance mechanosensitive channel
LEFFDRQILGSSLLAWLIATFVAIAVWALFLLLKRRYAALAARRADRDAATFNVLPRLIDGTTQIFAWGIALYVGARVLSLPASAARLSSIALLLIVSAQAARWAWIVTEHFIDRQRVRRGSHDAAFISSVAVIRFIARVAIWSLLLLFVLDNIGVDVTALVAGLGIGGMAAALAVQSLLKDLIGALSIALDRPFALGDTISVGSVTGKVERLGLKSTRLRSSSGEQIIVPNATLVRGRIRNLTRMATRRAVLVFSVAYETPLDRVRRVSELAADVVRAQPGVRLDRCHLRDFGTSGFNFEAVFLVDDPRADMPGTQQSIYIALVAALSREGVAFACPTQQIEHQAVPTLSQLS